MKYNKNKTLGKQYIEQASKDIPEEVNVNDLIKTAHSDYSDNIITCIENGKKLYKDDFFVVILQKSERLIKDINRFYFMPRLSCPTPTWDQIVYKYHRSDEGLEFLWVVPSKEVCIQYKDHFLEVEEEEKELLGYILDFYDGTLDKKAKELNNETNEHRIVLTVQE